MFQRCGACGSPEAASTLDYEPTVALTFEMCEFALGGPDGGEHLRPGGRIRAIGNEMTKRRSKGRGAPLSHENRKGVTYYLHEGRTKTGKPRYYFARTIREGALARMPEGYEVAESINGVVSVRRSSGKRSLVGASDLALVEAALQRHPHLRHHRATLVRDAIVIHAPDVDEARLMERVIASSVFAPRVQDVARERIRRARYSPVFQFAPSGSDWVARRMTYRGQGGWSWPLANGSLAQLVSRFIPVIGTEAFFDLE